MSFDTLKVIEVKPSYLEVWKSLVPATMPKIEDKTKVTEMMTRFKHSIKEWSRIPSERDLKVTNLAEEENLLRKTFLALSSLFEGEKGTLWAQNILKNSALAGDDAKACIIFEALKPILDKKFISPPPLAVFYAFRNRMPQLLLKFINEKYHVHSIIHPETGSYFIHLACEYDLPEVVQELLKIPVQCNKTKSGDNPLHLACRSGAENVVRLLFDRADGISLCSEQNREGQTPLHALAETEKVPLAECLLNKNNGLHQFKDSQGRTPFVWACEKNDLALVKFLFALAQKEDLPFALSSACSQGHFRIVQYLVDRQVPIDCSQQDPLYASIKRGHGIFICTLMHAPQLNLNFNNRFADNHYKNLSYVGLAALGGLNDEILSQMIRLYVGEKNGLLTADDLLVLCQKNQNRLVQPYLDKIDPKADLASVDENHNTLVHAACQRKDEPLLKYLLAHKVALNKKNKNGETPLHNVSENGFEAGFDAIIIDSTLLNAQDLNRNMPAHHAAHYGHGQIVKKLKKLGADFRHKNSKGDTPLDIALKQSAFEATYEILRVEKNLINTIKAPILVSLIAHLVTKNANDMALLDFLKVLLDSISKELWQKENPPLYPAIVCGNFGMLRFLLDYSKTSRQEEWKNRICNEHSLLEICLVHKHVSCAFLLIAQNLSAEGFGAQALNLACQNRLYSLIIPLMHLKIFPAVEEAHKSALLCATLMTRDIARSQELLAQLDDEALNQIDPLGRTPLHYACMHKECESLALKMLERKNVRLVQDERKRFPFHYACENGMAKAADLMLSQGCDFQIKDMSNQTPLHLACQSGLEELALGLIAKGAQPNERDHRRTPPLHYAIDARLNKLALVLLEKREQSDEFVDFFGNYPLLLAIDNQLPDVCEAILKRLEEGKLKALIKDSGLELFILACEKSLPMVAIRLLDLGVDCFNDKAHPQLYQVRQKLIPYVEKNCPKAFLDLFCVATPREPFKYKNTLSSDVHQAIEQGLSQWFDVLMADPNMKLEEKNIFGETPLHLACRLGLTSFVNALVRKGANLKAVDNQGRSALHILCYNRNTLMALDLLAANADPLCEDLEKKSSLMLAMEKRLYKLVANMVNKIRFERGRRDECTQMLLDWAAFTGELDLLKHIILQHLPDEELAKVLQPSSPFETVSSFTALLPSEKQNSSLYATYAEWSKERSYRNFLPVLFPSILKGRDLNPLEIACRYRQVEAALLLSSLSTPFVDNKIGQMPVYFYLGVTTGSLNLVQLFTMPHLLVSTDDKCNTPLHLACSTYNPELVRHLLESGSDVNEINADGNTALHILAMRPSNDFSEPRLKLIFQNLIDNGSNNNIRNKQGKTPLHLACENNNFIAATYLLSIVVRNIIKLRQLKKELEEIKNLILEQNRILTIFERVVKKDQNNLENISQINQKIESLKAEFKSKIQDIDKKLVSLSEWKLSLNCIDKKGGKPNLSLLFNVNPSSTELHKRVSKENVEKIFAPIQTSVSNKVIKVGTGDQQITFYVSTYILGARSKYFYQLFNPDLSGTTYKEENAQEILFPSEDPESFKIIIEYFYSNHLEINGENWMSLWKKMDFFNDDEALKGAVVKWVDKNVDAIEESFTPENCIDIMDHLTHINMTSLNKRLALWTAHHIQDISISSENYMSLSKYLVHLKLTGDHDPVSHPLKSKLVEWLTNSNEVLLDLNSLFLLVQYPSVLNLNILAFKIKAISFLVHCKFEHDPNNYMKIMKIIDALQLELPEINEKIRNWLEKNPHFILVTPKNCEWLTHFLKFTKLICPNFSKQLTQPSANQKFAK